MDPTRSAGWQPYAAIIGSGLLALLTCFLILDGNAQYLAIDDILPSELHAFFQCMGFFGHGTGCFIAVLLVFSLDNRRKAAIPFILNSLLLSGVVSAIVKIAAHRPRPFVAENIADKAATWHEVVLNNSLQSFPSGHTATAVALAISLGTLYPKGRYVFYSFAALVAVQRIISKNHFPSDCVAGALIGFSAASLATCFTRRRSKQAIGGEKILCATDETPIPFRSVT